MRKNIITISAVILLFVSIAIPLYSHQKLNQETNVYTLDIETGDFAIRGIEVVTPPGSLYISSHYLEKARDDVGNTGSTKSIEDIRYSISIGKTNILSVSQADNPFELADSWTTASTTGLHMAHTSLHEGINVRPSDTLHIQVMYKINGQEQQRMGEIKLSEVAKPWEFMTKVTTGDEHSNTPNVIDLR